MQKVFVVKACTLDPGDIGRVMTFVARKPGMLPIQGKTGGCMVELRRRHVPVQKAEVDAIMFGMTAHARRFGFGHENGV